jgi:hypothetical protein
MKVFTYNKVGKMVNEILINQCGESHIELINPEIDKQWQE